MGTVRTWEYWVDTLGSAFRGVNDENLETYLNQLGQEGWEVFCIERIPNSVKIRVVAKRLGDGSVQPQKNWARP